MISPFLIACFRAYPHQYKNMIDLDRKIENLRQLYGNFVVEIVEKASAKIMDIEEYPVVVKDALERHFGR